MLSVFMYGRRNFRVIYIIIPYTIIFFKSKLYKFLLIFSILYDIMDKSLDIR